MMNQHEFEQRRARLQSAHQHAVATATENYNAAVASAKDLQRLRIAAIESALSELKARTDRGELKRHESAETLAARIGEVSARLDRESVALDHEDERRELDRAVRDADDELNAGLAALRAEHLGPVVPQRVHFDDIQTLKWGRK